jgi:hypothetical protein
MLMFYYFRFALSLANLLGPGYTVILQKLLNTICEHMCSLPGFGGIRVARAPVFSPRFWWGPCCSSTCVLPQFLVGSVLLAFLVFCVVLCCVCLICLSCVLCTLCCQCLWIVHSWLSLRFSLTLIYKYTVFVIINYRETTVARWFTSEKGIRWLCGKYTCDVN